MNVEFIYWGNHELLDRLARPENVGRLRFWFGIPGFDVAWFTVRLDEAIKAAGPRYTPEIHVDLPIAAEFEAFGRTERFFDGLKAHARGIRKELRQFEYMDSGAANQTPTVSASAAAIAAQVKQILVTLGEITLEPAGSLPFRKIADQVNAAVDAMENFEDVLLEHERELDAHAVTETPGTAGSNYHRNPIRAERYALLALVGELKSLSQALAHAESLASSTLLLLSGDAGMGKTHLLCDVARARIGEHRPTVLLMGQRFLTADEPWSQALQQLDLRGLSAEEFVGALEAAAQAADCRALVLIDAINEGA